jgi:hypothetical protein
MKEPFTEIQKFTQWWIWVFLIGMGLLPVYGIYKQLLLREPWGSNPMSDLGLWIFLLGTLAFVGFFWYIELRTEIDEKGIRARLRPIRSKSFRWDEIEKVELMKYSFVGYGLRLSFKYGTVYNIRGNKGLAVHLKSGRRYLIGTQKQEEMTTYLRELGKLG